MSILLYFHSNRYSYEIIEINRVFVIIGANNPSQATEDQIYKISEIFVHESYNPIFIENDIALLKLSQPIDFSMLHVKNISLPSNKISTFSHHQIRYTLTAEQDNVCIFGAF